MKKSQRTSLVTVAEAAKDRSWILLDAKGKTLGRFASEITKILRGKHKVTYTPYLDSGDGVIVLNAQGIKVSGKKEARKIYRYHTGAMSGLREIPYRIMKSRHPEYIIRHAVAGMMPRTRLGKQQLRKLRIFPDEKHDMHAQLPIPILLTTR